MFIRTSSTADTIGFVRQLALAIIALVAVLAVVEIVVRLAVPQLDIVDVQSETETPADLYLRLDALRRFDGRRIVGIGDSVMHGETMAAHGNSGWRGDTITSQLKRRIAADDPVTPVAALNLGLNGAVPGDYERLVSLALSAEPDLIVMNTSMRSFSEDFNSDSEFMSRHWLADFEIDSNGNFVDTRYRSNHLIIEDDLTNFLLNHYFTYRYRDLIQQMIFGGRPREAMTRILKFVNSKVSSKAASSTNGSDMLTLLRAKQRYASIRFDEKNRQLRSLAAAIKLAQAASVPVVLVYGKENPSMIFEVIDRPAYEKLLEEFKSFASRLEGKGFAFIPPIEEFPVEHYLDLVHVDGHGYGIYVDFIFKAATKIMVQD